MRHVNKGLLTLGLGLLLAGPALADNDVEGQIESINRAEQSFVVKGHRYFVDQSTDYDDDLKGFADLKQGQRVEVDYKIRDGKRIVTEVELDD